MTAEHTPCLVNLTPHPIHIYPATTPDRIDPATTTIKPVITFTPAADHPPARLHQTLVGVDRPLLGVPIDQVAFGSNIHALPAPAPDVWYIVSLPVALANPHRDDFLVPSHRAVRDLDGHIIGSRGLARVVNEFIDLHGDTP